MPWRCMGVDEKSAMVVQSHGSPGLCIHVLPWLPFGIPYNVFDIMVDAHCSLDEEDSP